MAEREPLMTVSEVAAALHIGASTVKRMIRRREIRAARVGNLWRIPASEVTRLATPVEITPQLREPAVAEVVYSTAEPPIRFEAPATGRRIFTRRPWEQDDDSAASSAAGRSRTPKTQKAPVRAN